MIVRIIQGSIEPANEKGTQYEEKYEGPYGALIVLVVVVLAVAATVLADVTVLAGATVLGHEVYTRNVESSQLALYL